MIEVPICLGFPEFQQKKCRAHRNHGTKNVNQRRPHIVANDKLRDGEAESACKASGPNFHHLLPPSHGPDKPERNDEGEYRQLPSHHLAKSHFRKPGHLRKSDDRDTKSAVSNRSGVSDKSQDCSL